MKEVKKLVHIFQILTAKFFFANTEIYNMLNKLPYVLQVRYFHSNPPPYRNRFPVSFRNAVYFEDEKSIELQFPRQHFSLPLPAPPPPLKYKSRLKSCGAVKQPGLIITIGFHKRMGGVGRRGGRRTRCRRSFATSGVDLTLGNKLWQFKRAPPCRRGPFRREMCTFYTRSRKCTCSVKRH